MTVLVQTAAVSQVSLLGVTADLLPLIVMSVGLLAGSIAGSVMGFATGLLVDLALLQTLGLSSLIYVGIGYGAGRLRELRDPAHALIPVAVGAAATAIYQVGLSVMLFLLGAKAPDGLSLLRQILLTVIVNVVLAIPIYAGVRRLLEPLLPYDPRRRRRRAYTTGGLSPISRG
ncbi:MAG TPA: rod shape-determining protein MreD [Solirubrobacteraceae bacterium]|nr:rod shape-determining protein MreD [Solirubrobacteraceae bacterium]